MNNRLQQFLAAENITQASLASNIEVAPASVSHILQGRNKPSFEFLVSLVTRYPNLNIDWLLTGKGKMYKSRPEPTLGQTMNDNKADEDDKLFPFDENYSQDQAQINGNQFIDHVQPESAASKDFRDVAIESAIGRKSISKVIVFYDDNTFEEVK